MFKPLQGKIITVVGSSGFVGQNVIRQALEYGAIVNGISRRGYPGGYQQEWHNNVNWIRGDVMKPSQQIQDALKADLVVHTVGTLIDTSVLKRSLPGEAGTYEQMNRDALISVAQHVKGKIVYVSASAAPPYLPRYLTTKQEAENYLLELYKNKALEPIILRPGFIYSPQHRWWSVPIMAAIVVWRQIYKAIGVIIPQNSFMNDIFKEFNVDSCVRLDDVVDCALSSLEGHVTGQILHNEQIAREADLFRR